MTTPTCFRQIWFLDTEFYQPDGEVPTPICLVAKELYSGAAVQWWLWGQRRSRPPFPAGPDVLVVCYMASAEWSVYLAMDWPVPVRILDLHTEYRWLFSGFKLPDYGQLAAMGTYGLPHMEKAAKDVMRSRCSRGGPFSPQEERDILSYCEDDVDGLVTLFEEMERHLDWPRAVARGRYTPAVARMEANGIPLDTRLYRQLHKHRHAIRSRLIEEEGAPYGIYSDGHFDLDAFGAYLIGQGIDWPLTPTGLLCTREEVFEEMVEVYPQLRPLYELRSALGQLKEDGGLSVGVDGRNRTSLRPFSTSTGRNAPSTTKFIFGKSIAFRHLVKPGPGNAGAYVDWAQQEFGIGAALSDDPNMQQAYRSGDPYLSFPKQAGVIPASATKRSHGEVREVFKTCILGLNYAMGPVSLARRLKVSLAHARDLLRLYRQVFSRYWRWVGMVQDQAMITSRLHTVFGWQVNVGTEANPRSLRNFLMQANGAEMLRLACCMATERGIKVVAPVHDALLIEAPARLIDYAVREVQEIMAEASEAVLPGFPLRTEAKVFRYPRRYRDKRGHRFWKTLLGVLGRVKRGSRCFPSLPPYPPLILSSFIRAGEVRVRG
jgi:DNA polymerase I-like protein with 3'-5' exonuclease and polymerase domains